jgi:hypothetical protein
MKILLFRTTNAVALGLALIGCAHQPEMGWVRTDGKAVAPIQFEADETNCRGESDKADLSSTMRRNTPFARTGFAALARKPSNGYSPAAWPARATCSEPSVRNY